MLKLIIVALGKKEVLFPNLGRLKLYFIFLLNVLVVKVSFTCVSGVNLM